VTHFLSADKVVTFIDKKLEHSFQTLNDHENTCHKIKRGDVNNIITELHSHYRRVVDQLNFDGCYSHILNQYNFGFAVKYNNKV